MKEHEIRELVNQLRDVSIKYRDTQQLREQIARVIRAAMQLSGNSGQLNSPVIPDGWKLVPVEPTKDMLEASWTLHSIYHPSAYRDMLAAAPQPPVSDGWIKCSDSIPEDSGRYWCYVEEQNSLGKSHYQWNCSWNGERWSEKDLTGKVTHWMPLPEPPKN